MLKISIDKTMYTRMEQALLQTSPSIVYRAARRAVAYAASSFRKMLIKAVKTNELGWEELSAATSIIARYPARSGRRRLKAKPYISKKGFLGRMQKIFFYRMSEEGKAISAEIGLIRASPKLKKIFKAFQGGGVVEINGERESMRRYFGAIGLSLRKGTILQRPSRPLIIPLYEKKRDEISKLLAFKLAERIKRPK